MPCNSSSNPAHPTSKSDMDVNVQSGLWGTEQINAGQLCMMQMDESGLLLKEPVIQICMHILIHTYINIYTCLKI